MLYEDERSQRLIIERYQQRVFALALHMIGGDRDKAYDITASSFLEAIRATPPEGKDIFLARLAGAVVEKGRDAKAAPSSDETDLAELPPEKRKVLQIVRVALQALPFDTRALLLLRDLLHLSYREIAGILRISENNVKIQTTQARAQLRKKIEEVLSRA